MRRGHASKSIPQRNRTDSRIKVLRIVSDANKLKRCMVVTGNHTEHRVDVLGSKERSIARYGSPFPNYENHDY